MYAYQIFGIYYAAMEVWFANELLRPLPIAYKLDIYSVPDILHRLAEYRVVV